MERWQSSSAGKREKMRQESAGKSRNNETHNELEREVDMGRMTNQVEHHKAAGASYCGNSAGGSNARGNNIRSRSGRELDKRDDTYIDYRNHERYADPTAFAALRNIMREERLEQRQNERHGQRKNERLGQRRKVGRGQRSEHRREQYNRSGRRYGA